MTNQSHLTHPLAEPDDHRCEARVPKRSLNAHIVSFDETVVASDGGSECGGCPDN